MTRSQLWQFKSRHSSDTNGKSSKESYLADISFSDADLCESLTQPDTVTQESNKIYHPNGNLKYEGDISEAKKHGYGKLYHYNGRLLYEGSFVEDRIESEKALVYHYNGSKKYTGGYKKGRREGRGKLFHMNGTLR